MDLVDVCDAPFSVRDSVKIPVEHSDLPINQVADDICELFEEFLRLDEPLLKHWDDSLGPSLLTAAADSPMLGFSRSHAIENEESFDDDDNVPDCQALERPSQASAQTAGPADERPAIRVTNERTHQLAAELQRAGDALCHQYEGRVKEVESKLLQLVTQEAKDLTYDRFCRAADDLVGKDKNWTNFVFITTVAKRLCRHSKDALRYGKNHFERYVTTFTPTIQASGGVEKFVKQDKN
ncbi:uncharacterized protein LOC5508285 [Nematostella vectensis]|uniref:uncharacterized protein LOC5508285 n=1 Tax=Nematostella vectensis TaxID=45351 RepID=UPI002076EC15|nr:uncharacterized protein LOC5508285 [Nematostella vectensis]